MTLALHGKTKAHQGLLILAAILALAAATVGGFALFGSADAHEPSTPPNPGLQGALDEGGAVYGEGFNVENSEDACGPYSEGFVWHFTATPGTIDFVSLEGTFASAGTVTGIVGTPNGNHGWLNTPTADTLTAIHAHTTVDSEATIQLSHFCDTGNDPETRDVRVVKIAEAINGSVLPGTMDFSGTITNHGDGTWAIDETGLSGGILYQTGEVLSFSEDVNSNSHLIVETEDGDGAGTEWKLKGFQVIADPGDRACSDDASVYTGESATVLDDDKDYLVCILNQYDPATPPEDPSRLVRVIKLVQDDPGDQAEFTGTLTGEDPWTLQHGEWADYVAAADTTLVVEEDTPTGNYELVGYRVLEGIGSPRDCGIDADDYGTEPGDHGVRAGTTRVTFCVLNRYVEPTGNLIVKKVSFSDAADAFAIDVSSAGRSTTINLISQQARAFKDIPTGDYTVMEQDPTNIGDGYLQPIYGFGSIEGDRIVCELPDQGPAGLDQVISNVDAAGFLAKVGEDQTVVVCVFNTPAETPTIEKFGFETASDEDFKFEVVIDNTGGDGVDTIARTVSFTDPGATLVSDTLGLCSQSGDVITCTNIPAETEITLTLTVPATESCEGSEHRNIITEVTGAVPSYEFALHHTSSVAANPDLCGKPTVAKTGVSWENGVATWTVTVDNTDAAAGGTSTSLTIALHDAGGTFGPRNTIVGDAPEGCIGQGGPIIGCLIAADSITEFTVTTNTAVDHPQACEPVTAENEVEMSFLVDEGDPIVITDDATLQIPGNDALCDATLTLNKFIDINGDTAVTAGGVTGAGDDQGGNVTMVVTCNGTQVFNGQVNPQQVITIDQSVLNGGTVECVVSETLPALVNGLGYELVNGALVARGPGATSTGAFNVSGTDNAVVSFYNQGQPGLVTQTPPPPPPSTTPTPPPPVQETPEPVEPEPTPTEPTQETPAPVEPEPTEPAGAESTPIAPESGTGLTTYDSNSGSSLLFVALGLLAISGAAGAMAFARRS